MRLKHDIWLKKISLEAGALKEMGVGKKSMRGRCKGSREGNPDRKLSRAKTIDVGIK